MQSLRWHRFDSVNALCAQIVTRITTAANEAINARGAFHIVLAGGSTPQVVYEQLRDINTDWNSWFIYYGDERCLPSGDDERNDTMAQQSWLDHVAIPSVQIYSMPAELGAEQGAAKYGQQLLARQEFDLVLLGLGEDGHTASLFPSHKIDVSTAALAVHAAPKPPPERISLTASRLSAARAVWFLVAGPQKHEALMRWERGEDIPAAHIQPAAGVDIFTDFNAAN
ncbi:MAG: 6-phosphogluconolactonase [Verrucomicrobiaceae bacterium]|nr:6-phosphogluconolactonase [Verrucomicrobiaceae bacterium]